MEDSLMQKDLEVAQCLYNKIKKNKEKFIDLLDALLDLITFVPACVNEYGNNEFEIYNPSLLIVKDLLALLAEYGFKICRI